METNEILKADYLDILFDNRNKQYGSYAIRKSEDRRFIQAFLLLAGLLLSFCIWTFTGRDVGEATAELSDIPVIITDIIQPIIEPPVAMPPTPPEPPAAASTIENLPPAIVRDEEATAAPPPVDSFAGRESGPVTRTGDPNGTPATTTPNSGTGPGLVAPPTPPVIHDYVEVMPSFNGDMYRFLRESIKYPQAAIHNEVQGKVIVQFVVNEDGRISHAKVARGIGGGCDEEALRVVNSMPAWKPGKQNGTAVKVNFSLPINFRLQ